jgi:hypothetical protein
MPDVAELIKIVLAGLTLEAIIAACPFLLFFHDSLSSLFLVNFLINYRLRNPAITESYLE